MKTKYAMCFSVFIILFMNACEKDDDNHEKDDDQPLTLVELYNNAVNDAIVAEKSEEIDSLSAINISNPDLQWKVTDSATYVLVGCFTAYPDSYKESTITNWWGKIWVFIPAQMKKRLDFAPTDTEKDTLLRIRQLLGMPHTNTGKYIAALWVDSTALIRPAGDNEIYDNTASGNLSSDADSLYRIWFNENIASAYTGTEIRYPWTRLGYTYDWAAHSPEVGISEYCVEKNATMLVEKLYDASLFFK